MAHEHHIAPNAADVEANNPNDPTESIVNIIPVVIPAAGAAVMFLLALIAISMA